MSRSIKFKIFSGVCQMYSVAGTLLALFSCVCESIGLCVWRMASMEYFGAPNNAIRAHLLGLVFQGLGMLMNLAALSLMAESSVTIVNSFIVVCIIAVSWWLLGERPGVQSFIGAIIVFLGMALCVMSKPHAAKALTFDEIMTFLARPQDIAWLSCLFSFSVIMFCIATNCDKHLLLPFAGGFMGGISETLAKIMSGSFSQPSYAVIFLSVLAVTVSTELYMIKTSLIYLKPHIHTLAFFVSWSFTGILSGGIMFDEFAIYSGRMDLIGVLVFGILSIFVGALIPTFLGPPRRHARVFRSGHKAVPEIIACLIRPPFINVGQEQGPKYGIDSEDEEIGGYDGRGRGIELQCLTHVGSSDGRLNQGAADSDSADGPEERPVAVLPDNSDEE